jgi:hypothetical protein
MTPEQSEIAARHLCKSRNEDPDEHVPIPNCFISKVTVDTNYNVHIGQQTRQRWMSTLIELYSSPTVGIIEAVLVAHGLIKPE